MPRSRDEGSEGKMLSHKHEDPSLDPQHVSWKQRTHKACWLINLVENQQAQGWPRDPT